MAKPTKAATLDKVHSEALKRFDFVQDRERSQRTLGVEDMKFAHAEEGQWDENAVKKRRDRPRYTINRVAPAIAQIVGDQRQNRTSIKVRPQSGEADKSTAKIYDGLIRNIESQSQAESSYDAAFDETVTCGYGGWRLVTEFNDDDSFEQDIKVLPITSAVSSLFFGPAKKYDKRDADYAFYTTYIPISEYKATWPKEAEIPFDQEQMAANQTWFLNDMIRIAEYWRKRPITKTICLMSDGRILDFDEDKAIFDELAFEGITIEKKRKVKSHIVESFIMNGSVILRGPQKWAGKFIPLIPVFGKVTHIEGKEFVRGITRFAKDSNRIYNYVTSANVEAVALTPKDPYWVTTSMIGDYKTQFETFNQKNQPFMFYDHDPKSPGPPKRTGAPSVQTALLTAAQQASSDIEATTGMHSAALGNGPQLLSEKSMISQAEKGDRGAYIYNDNLQKSIQYTGDILVDLLPRIYDTERTVRTLGIDGATEIVKINERAFDDFNQVVIDEQTGDEVIVNDLSRGKYDVQTITGPAYATQKQESLEQLLSLSEANPDFAGMSLDLITNSLDIIDSEEIKERARKLMIERGSVEPTEEEAEEMGLNQPKEPDPQTVALTENVNSQTELNLATLSNKNADTYNKMVKSQQVNVDSYKTLIDTMKTKSEAGIPMTKQDEELLEIQRFMVEEGQESLLQEGIDLDGE